MDSRSRAKRAIRRRVWAAALVLGTAVGVAGCVTVTPAQRRDLSKPEMTPGTDASEDQFQAHIDNARRGSMGGRGGAAGGGCGCG